MWGTVLAIVGWIAALSILVQSMQEAYKYLSNSRARAYMKSLNSLIGPCAARLAESGFAEDLKVKGPLQFVARRPAGSLLPMERGQLSRMLERCSSHWIGEALKNLRLEAELKSFPSAHWKRFLERLENHAQRPTKGDGKQDWEAQEVLEFFKVWDGGEMTPETLRRAFLNQFAPHISTIERDFSQFKRNFEFAYRRQNLRLTFTFGFILAIVFNLPFQNLLVSARLMSTEQAEKIAAQAGRSFSASQEAGGESGQELAGQIVKVAQETLGLLNLPRSISSDSRSAIEYLLGCLFTSLLVSFGAPFWNDALGNLQRMRT